MLLSFVICVEAGRAKRTVGLRMHAIGTQIDSGVARSEWSSATVRAAVRPAGTERRGAVVRAPCFEFAGGLRRPASRYSVRQQVFRRFGENGRHDDDHSSGQYLRRMSARWTAGTRSAAGCTTPPISSSGMLWAAFATSPFAHAKIRSIDVSAARKVEAFAPC